MTIHLHKGDLPGGLSFGPAVAVDTETLGLIPRRDKLCVVQLSGGDLVDPLKALEMGQPGDIIVVDAGGDTEVSVCGGLMGGLAKNRGIRAMIVDGAGRDIDELEDINWPIWTRAITPRGARPPSGSQCAA